MRRLFALIIGVLTLSTLPVAARAEFISGPGYAAASLTSVDEMKEIASIRGLQKEDAEGVKRVITVLKDGGKTSFVRVEAARVLGRIGSQAALDALKEVASVTGNSKNVPAEVDPQKVVNSNGEVGAAAVVAIQKWRLGSGVQDMRDAVYLIIEDPSRAVRVEAALALAELGDERALPLLNDPGLLEAHEKLALLLEMKGESADARVVKVVDIIKEKLVGAAGTAKKEAAVSILAEMGSSAFPRVASELGALCKGNKLSDNEIDFFRSFSAAAMGAVNTDAVPALEKLENNSDAIVNITAKNAVMLISDGIPAVKHSPDFDGRGLLN